MQIWPLSPPLQNGRTIPSRGSLSHIVVACLALAASIGNTPAAWPAESNTPNPQASIVATPVSDTSERAGSGQRLTIQSTTLENLLLEKGIITQDDWLRMKAEEERRVFEQTAELQMAGNPRWYERIRISGYTQFRYAAGPTNSKFTIPLGDSNATGNPREFYIRRIRLVFQGQISERLAFFLQGAFEGNGQETSNREIIDAYADYYLTKDKEHRMRLGMHRTPNSFDTYRSSTNRQELDRHESIQSGAPGERDLGIAYYWSPKIAQERFAQLAAYHNGPGDYGVFGIMVYNGQGRNKAEMNGDKHIGVRLAYPFELPNGRLLETGVMAFRGVYTVTGSSVGSPTNTTASARCRQGLNKDNGCDTTDERITAYIWTPPQPWGLLAEGTIGTNAKRNSTTNIIEEKPLIGGYVQGYYTWRYSDVGMLTPYVRYGEYYGGIKSLNGAPDGASRSWNFGLVWEPDTHWRYVAELMLKDGLNEHLVRNQAQNDFDGSLFRVQAQWFFN